MVKPIRWSPRAVDQLEEICEFIARDSEQYAHLFAKRVITEIKTIPQFPKHGRVVPEYGKEELREKIYQNYRIVYRIKADAIEIAAIVHSARQMKNLL
jgi:toxin ParE1/3/4